jgi:hypothetical protein
MQGVPYKDRESLSSRREIVGSNQTYCVVVEEIPVSKHVEVIQEQEYGYGARTSVLARASSSSLNWTLVRQIYGSTAPCSRRI